VLFLKAIDFTLRRFAPLREIVSRGGAKLAKKSNTTNLGHYHRELRTWRYSQTKKFRLFKRNFFSLRRPDCRYQSLKNNDAKHTQNRAMIGKTFRVFFAMPTRLAVGLGTKKSPRVSFSFNASPRVSLSQQNFGSPALFYD
jgi:hypothetical protein